ncbi:hypothetical protein FOPE_12637 [Fonsecaea pedrosoi]|nr:hypothetical protein FOPE_12637 [Fonsecaea pedrosoi]
MTIIITTVTHPPLRTRFDKYQYSVLSRGRIKRKTTTTRIVNWRRNWLIRYICICVRTVYKPWNRYFKSTSTHELVCELVRLAGRTISRPSEITSTLHSLTGKNSSHKAHVG